MKRIFLDYASATPVDSRVKREMITVQKKFWGNPSSLHSEGQSAKDILEESRTKIARILHCRRSEVFFTSGGTESLNLAILGVVKSVKKEKIAPHLVVFSLEHSAVMETVKHLLKTGEAEVSFVQPDKEGIVNPRSVMGEIRKNTVLVIVQHANNEIGAVQPVGKVSNVVREYRQNSKARFSVPYAPAPYFLVDASQSVLYENVSLERLGADLVVLDGAKMYGPRGAGILAIKHGTPISPITFGGGQETGLRPGTENVTNAAGLAKALEIAAKTRNKESLRLRKLSDYAIAKIIKEVSGSSINGSLKNRLPNNINVCLCSRTGNPRAKSFPLVDSEFLVIKLDTLGFAASAASACHVLSLKNSSYVIESIGKPECGSSSLRFTLGRDTKKSDLDKLISTLKKIVK